MSLVELDRPPCFVHQLETLSKIFPNAKNSINKDLLSLVKNPEQGNQIPGYHGIGLYKARLPIKEYKISKRDGLRVIYLINDSFIFVAIYYKKKVNKEKIVQRLIKKNLGEIISMLD